MSMIPSSVIIVCDVCVENACETVWNALTMIVIDSMHFAYFLAGFKVSWGLSSIWGPSGTYTYSSILGVLYPFEAQVEH